MCSPPLPVRHDLRSSQPEPPLEARAYRIAPDVTLIEIAGGLNPAAAPLLATSTALRADPSDVPTYLEIDLHELTFLDPACLDALQAAVAGLEATGAQVTVVGAHHQVHTLLQSAAAHHQLNSGPLLAAATTP